MIPRSQLIESSLGCLSSGLLSLLPGAGVFFAPVALARFRFVVLATDDRWNPARPQLYLGLFLALLSLLVHGIIGVILYFQAVRLLANE